MCVVKSGDAVPAMMLIKIEHAVADVRVILERIWNDFI